MEIKEKDILNKTHYGLNIYSHILRQYYKDEVLISLSGKQCKPAKNPFRDDKKTLNIFLKDGVFIYEDLKELNFKGNPFSFAELHYKKSGDELMQILNKNLHLRIGKEFNFYKKKRQKEDNETNVKKVKLHIPSFSFFNAPVSNVIPKQAIKLVNVFELIKGDKYKQNTGKLRAIKDKKEARSFKANRLDYVTFSGAFTKRNDKALLNHSGLLTVDFDHISDVQSLKESLLQDDYFETELMFTSPSGNGLKWIIPIDLTKATHQNTFEAISNYIRHAYKIEIDKSGKDISRACFLSYDKEVYINPKYLQQ